MVPGDFGLLVRMNIPVVEMFSEYCADLQDRAGIDPEYVRSISPQALIVSLPLQPTLLPQGYRQF